MDTEGRLNNVEQDYSQLRNYMTERFNAVDARFNAIDAKFNAVDAKFNALVVTVQNMFMDQTAAIKDMFKAERQRNTAILGELRGHMDAQTEQIIAALTARKP